MNNKYLGRWRIVEMEKWEQDYVDRVIPGYIQFDNNDVGEFQFGEIFGSIERPIAALAGDSEHLEFSWIGESEIDPFDGRGWVSLNKKGQLVGRLYFHDGDESGFIAEKMD